MSDLRAEPWTNSIGQVINPGDYVVAVSKSTGTVGISTGKFAGVRYGQVRKAFPVLDAEGNQVIVESYGHKYPKMELRLVEAIIGVSITDVPTSMYKNVAAPGEPYKYEKVIRMGKSTLPRMRVFKIDTPASELTKINF